MIVSWHPLVNGQFRDADCGNSSASNSLLLCLVNGKKGKPHERRFFAHSNSVSVWDEDVFSRLDAESQLLKRMTYSSSVQKA